AFPCPGRAVLRRLGTGRTRPGPGPVLAPGRHPAGGIRRDRLLRRSGPQERLTARPAEPGGPRLGRAVTSPYRWSDGLTDGADGQRVEVDARRLVEGEAD